jgi:uncharacterized protein YjiS (DUF1127 family)
MPWRYLANAIERFRQDQQERRELQLMKGGALRDLGLHRSEYGSCVAEAIGAAEPTRRRICAVFRTIQKDEPAQAAVAQAAWWHDQPVCCASPLSKRPCSPTGFSLRTR